MANNNTMTQAQALRWLLDNTPSIPEDVRESAEKLYTAKTKVYDRPKTMSKEARLNLSLVDPVVEMIKANPDAIINATWINDHFDHPEVRSPQKARAIVDQAISQGKVEKYTVKGRVYYRAI